MYRILLWWGSKKFFLSPKSKILIFQNVELVELITNHPTCNYPSCTVTELFGLVTYICIVIFCWGGSSPKFFLSKIKISFFQYVELDELITNHPTCNYPSCTVTEIFGLVTSKCIVFFVGGGSPKFFKGGGAHQKFFTKFNIIPVYDDVIHIYIHLTSSIYTYESFIYTYESSIYTYDVIHIYIWVIHIYIWVNHIYIWRHPYIHMTQL